MSRRTAPATCALVHEGAECGQPATTTGPLGNCVDDRNTGPLCDRCALMQRSVMDAATRAGVYRVNPDGYGRVGVTGLA